MVSGSTSPARRAALAVAPSGASLVTALVTVEAGVRVLDPLGIGCFRDVNRCFSEGVRFPHDTARRREGAGVPCFDLRLAEAGG